MTMQYDGQNQPYIDVGNVRVTIRRPKDAQGDWAGTDRYLSLRAYRNSTDRALHQGAELPITSNDDDLTVLQKAADALRPILG